MSRWVIEGVADVHYEDDRQAAIAEVSADDADADAPFVRVQSWTASREHPVVEALAGQQVRVTVEVGERGWRISPALRAGDLRAALMGADDDDLVMGLGANLVPQYVIAVRIEPQSDDGEGHVTSTGGTVWLALEET